MKEHPQAQILRAIADGKIIEHRYKRIGWMSLSPSNALRHVLADGNELRIKPVTVTINSHEVPCPVRSALPIESLYYVPTTANPKERFVKLLWNNTDTDRERLSEGVVHLTPEAAIAHAEALLSFTRSDK